MKEPAEQVTLTSEYLEAIIKWKNEDVAHRGFEIHCRMLENLSVWFYDYNLMYGTHIYDGKTIPDIAAIKTTNEEAEYNRLRQKFEAVT